MPDFLYIFIDESGDFNFSKKGTKFYTFTAVMTYYPTRFVEQLKDVHFGLLNGNLAPNLDAKYLDNHLSKHFHACEDKQCVRDAFFNVIGAMDSIKANSVVVRKNRTCPKWREPKTFYSKCLGSLLKYIFLSYEYSSLYIFVDGCAVSNEKTVFKQTIADEITRRNPNTSFKIFFPDSSSYCHLQIVDYINWAVFRKWERNDVRSYDLIKHKLKKPEKDIFQNGTIDYY